MDRSLLSTDQVMELLRQKIAVFEKIDMQVSTAIQNGLSLEETCNNEFVKRQAESRSSGHLSTEGSQQESPDKVDKTSSRQV